ncbi:MAG: PQQ-binding-like beta-propeller repeat protein [Planctomycetota bacterium]
MRIASGSWVCIAAIAWTCLSGAHAAERVAAAGTPGPAELITTHARLAGGLCVVIGSDQAEAAIELGRTGRFLVQVLEADAEKAEETRGRIREQDLYGLVTVAPHPAGARLPFAENLANAVIVGKGAETAMTEVRRVLAPRGVALAPPGKANALETAGLRPEVLGAAANAWAIGEKPRPAEMDEWTHARHGPGGNAVSDDLMVEPPERVRWVAGPSVEISNVVSAAGRMFYGGVWARDAFNGLRLWERELNPSPARGNHGYRHVPGSVQPVACGERLLVVTEGKLLALDTANGEPAQQYLEAGAPEKILAIDGRIVAIDGQTARVLDAESGSLLWRREISDLQYPVAGDGAVFFLEGAARRGEPMAAASLELTTGEVRWRRGQDEFPWLPLVRRTVVHQGSLALEVSTLADEKAGNAIHLVSAADGKLLFSHEFVPGTNHKKQSRAMFSDDLLWVLKRLRCEALDPRTGEVVRSHPAAETHCFPPVATSRFMFSGELELTDLDSGDLLDGHRITKAACGRDAGWIPANGLIYTCPKHCVCWPMLRGYVALAPASPEGGLPDELETVEFPLERGVEAPASAEGPSSDQWPTYRHNAWRSAGTPAEVPAELHTLWTAELGSRPEGPIARDWRENPFVRGPMTAPVIAGGLVYVARSDAHEVVALDAASGQVRWRATVQGRVDTPPTIHHGLCLFGTKAGWVYALRADDGQLVWRRRAAPGDEQIVAYGQIESPWPVAGSVLAVDDLVYFAAGRQALADGGILVFAVETATGDVRWVRRVDSLSPVHFRDYGLPDGQLPRAMLYACNALEFDNIDLLHREGDAVAMSRWLFHRDTGEMELKAPEAFALLNENGSSVVVPRGSWTYAPRHQPRLPGGEPSMRPLVAFRDGTVFGVMHDMRTLYRRDFDPAGAEQFKRTWMTGWAQSTNSRNEEGEVYRSDRMAREAAWQVRVPPKQASQSEIVALLAAADTLFVAGSEGGLTMVSAEDGSRLAERELPAPIWDGMAAADGRLFVATQESTLICLGR